MYSYMLNSYNFPEIYNELGIDIKKLYCVMLDVGNLDYLKNRPVFIDNPDIFYTSEIYPWVKGWVANEAHCTLLYGLLNSNYKNIEKVLKGWYPIDIERPSRILEIEKFDYFSSYNGEDYYCVIGKVKVSEELLEGHERLSLLPHINTYLKYKPHITICYIKKDKELLKQVIDQISHEFNLTTEEGINMTIVTKDSVTPLKLPIQKIIFDNNSGKETIINI